MTRQEIDQICETQGYAAAKAAADKAGLIWFASAGVKRKEMAGWEREFWKCLSPEVAARVRADLARK